MPYAPLPRITLADALAEAEPLFPDGCPCAECNPQGHQETQREATLTQAYQDTRKTPQARTMRDRPVGELIDKVSRKYR
jgi:hypothetical protein